jgi:hypothetical protein
MKRRMRSANVPLMNSHEIPHKKPACQLPSDVCRAPETNVAHQRTSAYALDMTRADDRGSVSML